MRCSWTPEKYEKNLRRHGFSFELAEEAFEDPFSVTKEDYIDDNGEMRYQTIAAVEGDLLLIAHVYRNIEGEERPWIISVRKAVNYEQKEYFRRR